MAQHKFSDATTAFATATDLNPHDAEAFSDLGLVRMAQSHALNAAKALTRAIQLRSDYAEAHHRLELLRASQQDPEQLTLAALAQYDHTLRSSSPVGSGNPSGKVEDGCPMTNVGHDNSLSLSGHPAVA